MTNQEKKNKIKALVEGMLKESCEAMIKNIDTVLKSGVIDVENWDADHYPMILPKTILSALLEKESRQYDAKGTSFEKQMKKDIKAIGYSL